MAIIDGAMAAKWAWILLGYGSETPERPSTGPRLWWATSWKIALGMRMGKTFGQVTAEIMADIAALQEAVLTAPKNVAGKCGKGNRPNANASNDEETVESPPKGKGKGRKGQCKKRQYEDTQHQWWKKSQWQSPGRPRPSSRFLGDRAGVRQRPGNADALGCAQGRYQQRRRPDHRDGPRGGPRRQHHSPLGS